MASENLLSPSSSSSVSWTSLRKLRLTAGASSKPRLGLGLCLDTQMTTVNCFTLETDLGGKCQFLGLSNFWRSPCYLQPQAPGQEGQRLEPRLPHSHHLRQRMTDSEWIIYFLFLHSSVQMKTPPSEQNELLKLIPESVWGKWSMVEK